MAQNEYEQEIYEKLIGIMREPIIDPLPEHAQKIKRDFLAISILIILPALFGLGVNLSEIQIFKVKIPNFTEKHFLYLVSVILIYKAGYLIFYVSLHYKKHKIRLSGTDYKPIVEGTGGTSGIDYPVCPENSTLYFYLAGCLANNLKCFKEAFDCIKDIEEKLDKIEKPQGTSKNIDDIKKSIFTIHSRMNEIQGGIWKINENSRMKVSLENFDKGFKSFLNGQNYIFWIFDVLIPSVLFIGSLLCLTESLILKPLKAEKITNPDSPFISRPTYKVLL